MSIYRKLPASPTSNLSDETLSVDDLDLANKAARQPKMLTTLARHAVPLLCIFCTLINVLIVAFVMPSAPVTITGVSDIYSNVETLATFRDEEISNLRRPSQFIRFDEIQRSSPPIPRQFDNHPILIAQIDSADPDHVFGEVTRRYMAGPGTITPEDRRVLVTPSVSTVIQFRAIDYGMGICELRLTIPSSLMHGENPGLLDRMQSRPLTIYRLNSTKPLSARALSANTRPERVARVAEALLQQEDGGDSLVWHRKFVCVEEEILTFELACGTDALGDACTVEWWQDRESPNPAIYFTQYSTI